jgi:hypothetical protein
MIAATGSLSAWDWGFLAGLGSRTPHSVYGSVGAGIGYVSAYGRPAGVTIPVEAQVGAILTPTLGLGIYGFGSFAGPEKLLGLSIQGRLGHLR